MKVVLLEFGQQRSGPRSLGRSCRQSGLQARRGDPVCSWSAASSEFFDAEKGKYVFGKSDGSERNSDEMVDFYTDLVNKFPIRSIEDGCDENDWDGWKKLTDAIGDRVQLVGDDLFVTNVISSKKESIREWPIPFSSK